jgi:hypothetical protein
MHMARRQLWFLGIAGFLFAILFGRWAQSLFTQAELVHFSVNFPSDGRAETMSCCDLGGPWARDRDPDWSDYPAGGLLAYGEEGALVVDVGKQGVLKRMLQPNLLSISTHWLRNVGTQPYQIRLEMDMCGLDLEWVTFERDWDPLTKTSTRMIDPGDTFNMDWYFKIPPELRQRAIVCEGQLRVSDAQTETLLTALPIKILNSRAN